MSFVYPNPPPVFPTLRPGYSVHMKPTFASIVQTTVSGYEARSARQAYPLWEFELTFEILADATQNSSPDTYYTGLAELQKLCGLFLVTNGQYGRFVYSCPEDNSRTGQAIGTGDASITDFTMVRTWGTGILAFTEPVGWVDQTQAFAVYLNGVAQTHGVDYTFSGNTLTFTSPPGSGVAITADFFFYYFCRFLEDVTQFEEFYHNLWNLRSLKFRSVKQ